MGKKKNPITNAIEFICICIFHIYVQPELTSFRCPGHNPLGEDTLPSNKTL